MRKQFREQIRCVLGRHYSFYPMRSRGVDLNEYMTAHFRDLIGKVFTPFEDKNIVSLALEKTQDPQIAANQARLLEMLENDFYIDRNYTLGKEPELPQPIAMRFGLQDTVIIGYYRSEEQLNWIRENKLYNVRVGNAKGSVEISPALVGAKYLLLYGAQGQFKYRLAETSPTLWSKEDLKKKGYSNPHHDFYFMFHLSEQLVDGDLAQMQIDINKLESLLRSKGKMDNIFGRDPFPISMTELVNCQSAE